MASTAEEAAAAIRGWIRENVTGGREVADEYPLIENGVLTSLQTLELVLFLEGRFGVVIQDEELDEENFASVRAIANLVAGKQGGPQTRSRAWRWRLPRIGRIA